METDQLVNELVKKSSPVKPMRPPWVRALLWLFVLLCIVTAGISLYGARADLGEAMLHPLFITEASALLISGLCATFATFQLSVPRETISKRTLLLLLAAVLLLLASQFNCMRLTDLETVKEALRSGHRLKVFISGLAFISLPAILLYFIIRRGAPTRLPWIGGSAALALTSFSSLSCKFICPIDDPGYLLVWHYFPIFMLTVIGLTLGRRLFKW